MLVSTLSLMQETKWKPSNLNPGFVVVIVLTEEPECEGTVKLLTI